MNHQHTTITFVILGVLVAQTSAYVKIYNESVFSVPTSEQRGNQRGFVYDVGIGSCWHVLQTNAGATTVMNVNDNAQVGSINGGSDLGIGTILGGVYVANYLYLFGTTAITRHASSDLNDAKVWTDYGASVITYSYSTFSQQTSFTFAGGESRSDTPATSELRSKQETNTGNNDNNHATVRAAPTSADFYMIASSDMGSEVNRFPSVLLQDTTSPEKYMMMYNAQSSDRVYLGGDCSNGGTPLLSSLTPGVWASDATAGTYCYDFTQMSGMMFRIVKDMESASTIDFANELFAIITVGGNDAVIHASFGRSSALTRGVRLITTSRPASYTSSALFGSALYMPFLSSRIKSDGSEIEFTNMNHDPGVYWTEPVSFVHDGISTVLGTCFDRHKFRTIMLVNGTTSQKHVYGIDFEDVINGDTQCISGNTSACIKPTSLTVGLNVGGSEFRTAARFSIDSGMTSFYSSNYQCMVYDSSPSTGLYSALSDKSSYTVTNAGITGLTIGTTSKLVYSDNIATVAVFTSKTHYTPCTVGGSITTFSCFGLTSVTNIATDFDSIYSVFPAPVGTGRGIIVGNSNVPSSHYMFFAFTVSNGAGTVGATGTVRHAYYASCTPANSIFVALPSGTTAALTSYCFDQSTLSANNQFLPYFDPLDASQCGVFVPPPPASQLDYPVMRGVFININTGDATSIPNSEAFRCPSHYAVTSYHSSTFCLAHSGLYEYNHKRDINDRIRIYRLDTPSGTRMPITPVFSYSNPNQHGCALPNGVMFGGSEGTSTLATGVFASVSGYDMYPDCPSGGNVSCLGNVPSGTTNVPLATTAGQDPYYTAVGAGATTAAADPDECTLETHNCAQFAVCTDTVGSFTCACPDGFIGDGISGSTGCNLEPKTEDPPGIRTLNISEIGSSGGAMPVRDSNLTIALDLNSNSTLNEDLDLTATAATDANSTNTEIVINFSNTGVLNVAGTATNSLFKVTGYFKSIDLGFAGASIVGGQLVSIGNVGTTFINELIVRNSTLVLESSFPTTNIGRIRFESTVCQSPGI